MQENDIEEILHNIDMIYMKKSQCLLATGKNEKAPEVRFKPLSIIMGV